LLRRNITYENPFTEKEVTEEHYFHISKADLVEMELEEHGTTYTKDGEELTGMRAKLQSIVDAEDGKAIMAEFKDIIRRSYGRKEGERFVKRAEYWDDFAASEAFSQLLFELCTDPGAAAEFVNGVVPGNLDQIAEEARKQAETVAAGRAAQEAAKASASPEAAVEAAAPAAEAAGLDTSAVTDNGDNGVAARQKEIEDATSENPVTLTEAEVRVIDSDDLRSGLATGRYKIAST
jgi:hypothetical protein